MKHLNKFNENMGNSGKWFFGKDQSSHWYMVPFELRDKWNEMTLNDFDDDDYEGIEEFDRLFSEYMLGGGIESYVFENPIEIR